MRIKFDSLDRFEIPKMYLCNPGAAYSNGIVSKIVCGMSGTSDEELIINFNAPSELNFRAYKHTSDDSDEIVFLNNFYRAVKNRRLIFVEGVGFFIITSVNDDFDGRTYYKDVRAQSCDIEIQNKMLTYIEDGTYAFTDLIEKIVSTLPLWAIGHIDQSVAEKFRTFTDVGTDVNTLSFMVGDLQDAYECIFIFDIINRRIEVYDQNNYVRETSIHLTKNDVVNSIEISEDSDNLYTALRVFGEDELSIGPVNPLGGSVVYNFSYYLSWMSDSLREKVLSWQNAIADAQDQYYDLNLQYYDSMASCYDYTAEMTRLSAQMSIYKKCRDNIVANNGAVNIDEYNKIIVENGGSEIDISAEIGEVLSQIDTLIVNAQSKYDEAQARCQAAEQSMQSLNIQISEIIQFLSISSYFSEDEYSELSHYIFEGSYTDEYITVTNSMSYHERFQQMKVLYDRAKTKLEKVSMPTQEFTIDVENFLFAKEFEAWSEQLETGCLINVELDDYENALLFLSNMVINYFDKSLSMTFGNRFNRFDQKSIFDNALGDIKKTSNTLDYIKELVYPIKNGEFDAMKEALETSRTLTMRDALSSENQEFVLDGSGYTGRQLLPSGMFDPRQVKLTSKNIVFTDDAWETCKVALGELILGDGQAAYGINAQTIIGQMIMGNNLRILDDNGNDLLTVVDGMIQTRVSNYENSLTELKQTADSVIIRVSALEENRDVTSITTTTGYTFGADGLIIHKSGEEITNRLDNTGMYVSRGEGDVMDDILIANNLGVEAINLTAKQYLTIGTCARFEAYNNGDGSLRTGCFYVNPISVSGGDE